MLTVLMITNNQHPHVERFVLDAARLAFVLGANFVLGLDRDKAWKAPFRDLADVALELTADTLQENVMDQAIDACKTDWILRLDDDERVSQSLERWLQLGYYAEINARVYAFPRVYLWPDREHFLTNKGMYPDLQTRLGQHDCMYGVNYVHAGNRCGTGQIVPYAIEHHNLLVKTRAERDATLARYESLREGAGTLPQFARYNVPERFYDELEYKEYGDGDFSAR